jgi:hypothetical protein
MGGAILVDNRKDEGIYKIDFIKKFFLGYFLILSNVWGLNHE